LHASGARPFTVWASAISTDQPPPRERPQRVDIGRHDELVEMLSLIGDKTHVKLASSEI
jgi:hypothetical protein